MFHEPAKGGQSFFSEMSSVTTKGACSTDYNSRRKRRVPSVQQSSFVRGQANVSVPRIEKGFGAFGQFGEVSVFQGLGERVEQAPDATGLKAITTRFSPFLRLLHHQTVGAQVLLRTRAPAWPVTETGPVLVERRGGTGPASGIGDAAKGGRGNGWSAIRTTQEPMPDGPLAAGEDSRAWVNAAREAWKAKPAVGWQRSLMHLGKWRSELGRRSSELRRVESEGRCGETSPLERVAAHAVAVRGSLSPATSPV